MRGLQSGRTCFPETQGRAAWRLLNPRCGESTMDRSCAFAAFAMLAIQISCGQTPQPAASDRTPGLAVRLYELDQDVAFVPDLAPGQAPSDVIGVETLDLKEPFGTLKEHFLT